MKDRTSGNVQNCDAYTNEESMEGGLLYTTRRSLVRLLTEDSIMFESKAF
jgi:hypothetical protein